MELPKRQAMYAQKMKEIKKQTCAQDAERIVFSAIQRISQKQIPEASLVHILLPDEDVKGKIIGKEGKNLRAFEAITGVTLMIDDAPRSVFISSFDPCAKMDSEKNLTF